MARIRITTESDLDYDLDDYIDDAPEHDALNDPDHPRYDSGSDDDLPEPVLRARIL